MSPLEKRPKLTDATLAVMRCPEGRKDALVFDAVEPGFGVRLTADGKRVILFQYRLGKTVRRHRIGVWGEGGLTASKARKEAERLRGLVHSGRDPVGEKRSADIAIAGAERLAREQATADAFTLGKLIDGWEQKGLAHRKPSYAIDATTRLRAYFSAELSCPAAALTRAEAMKIIDRIERDRGTTSARRGLAYARACYSWGERRNLLEVNPFRGLASPGKENTRDRVLTDAEIGAIWRASDQIAGPIGGFVQLLLLSLQRLGEVAGMRWDELAPDLTIWTLPASRTKNSKAHVVHLAPQAREIIRAQPRLAGCKLVFVSRRKSALAGFSHMKEILVAKIEQASPPGSKRPAPAGPTWRFHDFRRTGVTALANARIPPHVADRLLNHVTGAIQGVAAVYQRAEFMDERRAALETWAEHVLRCAGEGVSGSVVQFVRRSAGHVG